MALPYSPMDAKPESETCVFAMPKFQIEDVSPFSHGDPGLM